MNAGLRGSGAKSLGFPSSGARMGSNYVLLGVGSGYMCFGGVGGVMLAGCVVVKGCDLWGERVCRWSLRVARSWQRLVGAGDVSISMCFLVASRIVGFIGGGRCLLCNGGGRTLFGAPSPPDRFAPF